MNYDPEIMDNRRCYTCKHTYVAKEMHPCALCYTHKQKPKWEPYTNKNTKELTEDLKEILKRYEGVRIAYDDLGDMAKEIRRKSTVRNQILTDAHNIVCKGREQEYGGPEDSFSVIAKLWSDYTDHHFDAHDVAIMMSLLKIARLKSNPRHRDSWVDLAGYAACGGECACHE